MATPTISQLAQRVSALDGIGALSPSGAVVPTIFNDLNGLHTTISQLTLTIQSQLNTTITQVNTYVEIVNQLLGATSGGLFPQQFYFATQVVGQEGQLGYMLDGTKVGEEAGHGTGIPVFWSSGAILGPGWYTFSTNVIATN